MRGMAERRARLATAAACAGLLAGCAPGGPALRPGVDPGAAVGSAVARENVATVRETAASLPMPAPLVMLGSLVHRERIALPPGAVAVVELRDVATPGPSGEGRVVAERRIALDGRQVPVPYTLHVERADLLPAGRHELRGMILVEGRVAWRTAPLAVDITVDRIDTGELLLRRQP